MSDFLEGLDEPTQAAPKRHSISEVTTLLQCSQRWYYKYRLRLPDPPGPAAQWGIDFHAAVEARYKGQPLPEMAPDIAAAFEVFDRDIASRVRPLEGWVERWVDYTLGGVPFVGKIDVVDDQLTVRDNKTKNRRPSQQDVNDSIQLTAYWEAVRQIAGETPKAVAWDVLVRNKTPVAETYIADRQPRDVARLERIVLVGFEAVDKGYIIANWGGLYCGSCPFRERCIEDNSVPNSKEVA